MTRADRATNRAEFSARFERLCAAASSGAQALAAQGALAVLWHHDDMTAGGHLAKTPVQTAELLGIDARTWRQLAQILEESGLLVRYEFGYRVPNAVALEGVSDPSGVPGGFLRTYRPAYADHVAQVRAAGRASGHQGAYVLAALGAYELLRVARVNWRTGVTSWAGAAAARLLNLTRRVWAGYLRLLETASLVARAGGIVRMLGWHSLSWGPSWRLERHPRRGVQMQDRLTSMATQVQDVLTLSTPKSRAEGRNIPPTPTNATANAGLGSQTRRRDHPDLQELLHALAARVPAAAHARWRPRLRQELSYALAASGGDVAGLARELTQRELKTARNLPGALAWRCGQAVELLRAKQAAQETRERVQRARADTSAQEAAITSQASQEAALGDRLAKLAGGRWARVQDQVADELRRPRIGAPGSTAGGQALIRAQARVRIRETVTDLLASQGSRMSPDTTTQRDARGPLTPDTAPDAVLLQALKLAMARKAQEGPSGVRDPRPGTSA